MSSEPLRGPFVPGDFLLVDGVSTISRLICFGQRLRFTGARRRHARWSHAALIETDDGGLIEAKADGVVRGHIADYAELRAVVVPIARYATAAMRVNVVSFARRSIGRKYGYFSYLAYLLWALFGAGLSFGLDGAMVCSGLVSKALERTACVFPKDSANMTPAHLAEHFQVD